MGALYYVSLAKLELQFPEFLFLHVSESGFGNREICLKYPASMFTFERCWIKHCCSSLAGLLAHFVGQDSSQNCSSPRSYYISFCSFSKSCTRFMHCCGDSYYHLKLLVSDQCRFQSVLMGFTSSSRVSVSSPRLSLITNPSDFCLQPLKLS